MARPLRLEFPGAIYHVTSRGNAAQAIVLDDADRAAFLSILAEVVDRFGWRCHAYCLMDNHYHLMIETPLGNLSRGMRQLNGLTTQRFNRRHERVGHLYQGRYKAILVERDSYLLELCRYVVLNPVRAGMVSSATRYRWSSFRATAGRAAAPPWLTTDWLLSQFGARRRRAQERYVAFVAEGRGQPAPWPELIGQVVLGRPRFVGKLRPRLEATAALGEVPRAQRLLARPSLDSVLGARPPRSRSERNRRIAEAHLRHRYTLAEIGRHLGLHYSTVSKIAKGERRNFEA